MTPRIIVSIVILGLLAALLACGLEDPSFEITTGSITVGSTPDSAAIFLDGAATGRVTPDTLSLLEPGEHVVRVERTDHADASQAVAVVAGRAAEVSFTLTSVIGGIEVTSNPDGAAVFLDDADTGETTPALLTRIAVGEHVVHVVLAGSSSDPESRTVTVEPGATASADFTLTEIPGSLAVTSTPSGAAIHVDGTDTGEITPATISGLSVGQHTVSVVRAGWTVDPVSRTVTIAADEIATAGFTLTEITGSLTVTSTPPGAAIALDGTGTGEITPATIDGLSPGEHAVSVTLDGYTADPASATVTVIAEQTATVDFTLTPAAVPASKVVLLEGFSNVCCPGCPEMNAALHEFLAREGYGPDRVLLIKFTVNYPSPLDPHYVANPADNDARAWGPDYDMSGYYADQFISVPTLFGDGALLGGSGTPPTVEELGPLVDARLAEEPGFGIQVAANVGSTEVTATVTLAASASGTDLTGMTLNAALVQNPIVYAEAPCDGKDELEFHWIMRDFEIVTTSLDSPAAGSPVTETVTLTRDPAWPADDLFVVAFVQNDATREVLQAGSNIPAAHAAIDSRIRTATPRPANQPEAH